MKVFVDTNVILDVMLRRPGFYESSRAVFDLAEDNGIIAFMSAVSMTDIFYILRKFKRDSGEIYSLMDDLAALFSVTPVTQNAVHGALALRWKDFEDAVQYTAAREAGAACIVTRNKTDFETSRPSIETATPCVSPAEFIALYNAADKK